MRAAESHVKKLVQGLTAMNAKQLKGVAHLVTPRVIDAIAIASKIDGTNQGRRRQEGLVAKMLREEADDDVMAKLEVRGVAGAACVTLRWPPQTCYGRTLTAHRAVTLRPACMPSRPAGQVAA